MLPMPELTEKQLLELLRARGCPLGSEFRSGQKTRPIALPDLLAFIEQEVGHPEGLEGEVDALMTGLARKRLSLVDPWSHRGEACGGCWATATRGKWPTRRPPSYFNRPKQKPRVRRPRIESAGERGLP